LRPSRRPAQQNHEANTDKPLTDEPSY